MSVKIKENIHFIGIRDWDRRLFDELIPLPDGTSYNCYIIKGTEKTALIDTVDGHKSEELLKILSEERIDKIDYIVINHAEKDHSGALPEIMERYPEAIAIMNQKCKEILLPTLPPLGDKIKIIQDRETLSLGDKTLEFFFTPWVHWPETMVTLAKEDKILFTCDFFGSHIATSVVYEKDEPRVYEAAKRYYAEIMMPFRKMIQKHLKLLEEVDFTHIAPSHGPLYDNPAFIIDAYRDWVSDEVKNLVVIPWVSMYSATETMVNHLTHELMKRNIRVIPYHLTNTDIGELAKGLVDVATIVVASPTVLGGAHPVVAYAVMLANALRPKVKYATVIGSYGWKGSIVEQIVGMIGKLKVELLEPCLTKGLPTEEDLAKITELAEQIFQKHKDLGII